MNESKRDKVKRLAEAGCTPREISYLTGMSTQGVYKHLKNLRESGELAEEKAS